MASSDSSRRQPEGASSSQGGTTGALLGVEVAAGDPAFARPEQPTVISNRPPLSAPPENPVPSKSELRSTLVGERLNHFELQEYIGGGGMGAVFRALDTELNRTVALKILARDQSYDDETARRFRNEAQSAARLDHENIARVFYIGEDRGMHYIAFEYIEGVNIRRLVERSGPLPLADAVNFTLQIAEALAHASSRDVVHRDIKPSNVVITAQGRAKLVDMGLARVRQVDRSGDDLTASGVTLGTFDYISPEQARDPRTADVRSDIYSLGCTLYYMLTGRPPFPNGTVLQKLLQHQGDAPPDPLQFNPDLPEELCRIVRRMLAKDPRRRYQHPDELLADLCLLAEELGWQPRQIGSLTWAPARSPRWAALERHIPWLVPVAALVGIVLLLDYLWTRPGGSTTGPNRQSVVLLEDPNPTARSDRAPSAEAISPPVVDGAEVDAEESTAPADSIASSGDRSRPVGSGEEASDAQTSSERVIPTDSADETDETPSDPPVSGDAEKPSQPGAAAVATNGDERPSTSAVADATTTNSIPTAPIDDARATQQNPATGAATTPADAASGGTAPADGPSSPVPAARDNVLIVNPAGDGEHEYRSLADACAAAQSGDIIELRFNGRHEEARPIQLSNKRLTIRADKDGLFRPVVVFRPQESDPTRYPRSMLAVVGGQLVVVNVAFELAVPRLSTGGWTLIEAQQAESVRLDRCSLTVRNAADSLAAHRPDVSFLAVTAPPGENMMMGMDPLPTRPVRIELQDCVARGEAAFLRSADMQPFDLRWENGLLATSEQFLLVKGGAMPPRNAGIGQIDLRHVTMRVGLGVCVVDLRDAARYVLPTKVSCSDSILVTNLGAAVVQQNGADAATEYSKTLAWSGNGNFYDGFGAFWRLLPAAGVSAGPQEWTLDKWLDSMGQGQESMPREGPVAWTELPEPRRPLHAHVPADYALDESTADNPAKGATNDGKDVGAELHDLPAVPANAVEAPRGSATQPAS